MTITLKDRSLNLATEFKRYIIKHAGADFFDKWERYNRDHRKAADLKYNSANVLTYIRPSWYTGATKCKYIPRHHILWCLYHDVTEVPKGYVVYHPHSKYNDGSPDEFVCLTRSEHQQLVNAKRREAANGLPTV
jgi:hypothetical protein